MTAPLLAARRSQPRHRADIDEHLDDMPEIW
jgi:hypothetical protein